jgi:hypothetical protein
MPEAEMKLQKAVFFSYPSDFPAKILKIFALKVVLFLYERKHNLIYFC